MPSSVVLVIVALTDTGAFAGSTTFVRADGAFEIVSQTPTSGGPMLGHSMGGRMRTDELRRIRAGIEATTNAIRLERWHGAGEAVPRHLWGREALLIGRSDGSQWTAADAAGSAALERWVEELDRAILQAMRGH